MDEQVLLSLNDEELFRIFLAKKRDLIADKHTSETDVEKIRNGVNIKFSLSKYFKYKNSQEWGIFRQKPKSNTIRADASGYVTMDEFNDELEERNSLMLNALLDYYGEDDDTVSADVDETSIIKKRRK